MKKYIFLINMILCNLLVAYTALAQTTPEWCGTIPTQEQIEYLNQSRTARQAFSDNIQERSIIQIPIVNHIARESDGSGGLTTTQLTDAIQDLNDFYAAADIEFYECDSVQYIDNSNWYNFDKSEEDDVLNTSYKTGALNIYYFNDVTNGDNNLCGYASFPPSVDRAIMKNSCATNGSTLIHEIGHYFSLYHTHGKDNCGTTDELVNGSNCATAGDDVCDTPADPNLYYDCATSLVNSSCQYIGTYTDATGAAYNPSVSNIMSYAPKSCRTDFTQGQFDRARYSALNDRAYLTCIDYCIPVPVVPMNSNDIYIENVTLEQINNTSGSEGYADFTSTPAAELLPTGSYTISLQKYDTPSNWPFYWYVWIDYNKNNQFETSELVVQVSGETSDNITQNFVVPADANGITRMRVYLKYSFETPAPEPCEGAGYIGEIEDYTIMIGSQCAPNYNLSGTVDPGLYKAEDYIESTGLVVAGDDVTFQAGNIVRLLPGFHAQADISSKFHALIQECTASEASEAADIAYEDDIPLVRNFPNPFTGQTTIEFTISEDTPVTLSVSDANGRQVAVLLNHEVRTQGTHQLTFDGSNYPAGVYYYIIQVGEYVGTQKMVLVK